MMNSRHPLFRFGQAKGRIRRTLVFAGTSVALCVIGLSLSWTQPNAQEAQPSPLTPAQAMANLTAPPAPGSFAVADDHAPSRTPSKEERLATAQAIASEVRSAFAAHRGPLDEADTFAATDCVARLDAFLSEVTLQFGAAQTTIAAEYAPLVERISDEIQNCPNAYVMIAGHADGSGSDRANSDISWGRADQTLNHLVAMGVDPNAVEAVGFGASRPLSQGSDEEDAADRRVEFRVLRLRAPAQ